MRGFGFGAAMPYSAAVHGFQQVLNLYSSLLGARDISEDGYAGPETLLRMVQVVPLLGNSSYLYDATSIVSGCVYRSGDWWCETDPVDYSRVVDAAEVLTSPLITYANEHGITHETPKMPPADVEVYKAQLVTAGLPTDGIDSSALPTVLIAGVALGIAGILLLAYSYARS